VDFAYPVKMRFECSRCGLCCGDTKQKTRHILLLKKEAEKIRSQTGESITCFSIGADSKYPYVYEMKKSSEGKCVFLKDNQCSIYALRPLVCMFYPFELKFDCDKERYDFSFTVECPGINQGKLFSANEFKGLFDKAQERLNQKVRP
jgi:Fe-S-cluster containining protein